MNNTDKNLALGFSFIRIETEQFATVEEAFDEQTKDIKLNSSIGFAAAQDNTVIRMQSRFQYEQKSEAPFLIIAVHCDFKLTEEAWQQLHNDADNIITLPLGFASHLALLTIGTVRGILHEKTVNTKFNKFILPTINLSERIKEDVVIDLNEEKE